MLVVVLEDLHFILSRFLFVFIDNYIIYEVIEYFSIIIVRIFKIFKFFQHGEYLILNICFEFKIMQLQLLHIILIYFYSSSNMFCILLQHKVVQLSFKFQKVNLYLCNLVSFSLYHNNFFLLSKTTKKINVKFRLFF